MNPRTSFQLVAAALVVVAARATPTPMDERVTTTSKGQATTYVTRTLEGFTVHVDERLLGVKKEVGDAALAVLQSQLFQIGRALRTEPLAQLRAIPLWLGVDDPVAPCACYHPSSEWLKDNGFDPQKAKSVEIAHADAFVQWTHEQPWMVLHELAHGVKDRRLSPNEALGKELAALYEKAKANGKYDAVLHWTGDRPRHYAMNNADEYFAEASEAWLGTNDFFPFVHAELVEFDPELAKLVAKVWGEPITSRG